MIFPNNNKAVVKKLANSTLKYNKTRNIMVIIAIALTTTLFTTLFTISMGILNTMQVQTMRQSGGSAHGTLKYLKDEEFKKLKNHPSIKQIEYSMMVGRAENSELLKHYTEVRYATDGEAKMCFSYPTKGNMPKKEEELATDTLVLDLLGIPKEIGKKVTIDYSINGQKFSKKFTLVGYWEHDEISPASMVYVSKEFTDDIFKNFNRNIKNKSDGTGLIFADIMFNNSLDINDKMQKVIAESGYSIEEDATNYIDYGVNWAYMSTNFRLDAGSIIAIVAISMLIIFTGYLIIYNIFQISVFRDIRYYGLLKTIGTTSKQIKKIIRKQAFLLSLIGIPIGLIMGGILGVALLPIVFKVSSPGKTYTSFNPIIFIASAIFSYITVFISSRKPGEIAANVSPIEAVRYTGEVLNNKRNIKRSSKRGRIYTMGLSNLTRNKKKTAIVIISMSLSLILLNSVFTIVKGFDMDKYVSKFLATDFVIGNANYFNKNLFKSEVDEVSEKMIKAVNSQQGFLEGGRIFYNLEDIYTIHNNVESIPQLYGADDFPLSQLNIVEGKLDLEKLKTGKYIIEGVQAHDNGTIKWESSKYHIGDKVIVKLEDGSNKSYEVMAKAEIEYTFSVRYYRTNTDALRTPADVMYLPFDEYKKIVKKPITMNYVFNVDEGHSKDVDKFLNNYTNKLEPTMNYESKNLFVNQFKELQNIFLIVGGGLSLIVGIIGLLNFINSILTSIIARRKEFAMLQSIGMTKKQLCRLLMYEGFFYAICTTIITLVIGAIFSLSIIRGVVGGLWFYSYKFVILPLLISAPFLILTSILIPFIIYKYISEQSIVERLRESE